ncbi:MAG: hypothetical protein JHC33_15440 [Ignisphaera sp.]|nr:hypothetical protein [Ignisphaera sp.]
MAQQPGSVSEDEKLWALIAWLLSIVGAVLVLVLKSGYRYAKYWAYLSISFFIVLIVAMFIGWILAFIPFIGWILSVLIELGLAIIWIIGIVRVLQITLWKPPIVYDIAKMIGIESL